MDILFRIIKENGQRKLWSPYQEETIESINYMWLCYKQGFRNLPSKFVKDDNPTYSLETEDAQMSEVQLIVRESAIYP